MVIYILLITFYVAVQKFFNVLLAFPFVKWGNIAFLPTDCVLVLILILVAILNLLNAVQVLAYENVMIKLLSKNIIWMIIK